MNSKLRSLAIVLFLGLLAVANLASHVSAFAFQTITPTPTGSPIPVTGESQAGTTNGITLLGIIIFTAIVLAVVFHLKTMRTSQG